MKKAAWLGLAALVAVSAVFAACGGDDDDAGGSGNQTSNITTNKGAAVQALLANITGQQGVGGAEASTDDAAAAPAVTDGDRANRSAGDFGADTAVSPAQVSDGAGGITVQGYGSASADADSAVLEFYFGGNYYFDDKPIPVEPDGGSGSSGSSDSPPDADIRAEGSAEPITEADLQPVIDALVGAGVSRGDIEFVDQGYYDPYYASATLRATVNDVSLVDGAVEAANNAASNVTDYSLQSSNVSYTLQDCSALQQAALEAAVEDASDRGALFAAALGVGLGDIVSAADYSYYDIGGTGCGSSYPMPYYDIGVRGSSSQQVQVFEQISITYAIQ